MHAIPRALVQSHTAASGTTASGVRHVKGVLAPHRLSNVPSCSPLPPHHYHCLATDSNNINPSQNPTNAYSSHPDHLYDHIHPTKHPNSIPPKSLQQQPWPILEMALLMNNSTSSSNSKNHTSPSRANTQASAYIVNATSMELTGFHFSTSTLGAGGAEWRV